MFGIEYIFINIYLLLKLVIQLYKLHTLIFSLPNFKKIVRKHKYTVLEELKTRKIANLK